MQNYTDTLCTTRWQMSLTKSLLQEIPTFDGWDTLKLEDLLRDIEKKTADILKESCTCLAEAKSHGLTYMLVCEALQAGKWWDKIRDILHLKLYNVKIHTHTLCFMEIQQRDNRTLAAYVHHFKIEAKRCDLSVTPLPYTYL